MREKWQEMEETADLGRLANVNQVRGDGEAGVLDEETDSSRPGDVDHVRGNGKAEVLDGETQGECVHREWRALQVMMMGVADESAARRREAERVRRAEAHGQREGGAGGQLGRGGSRPQRRRRAAREKLREQVGWWASLGRRFETAGAGSAILRPDGPMQHVRELAPVLTNNWGEGWRKVKKRALAVCARKQVSCERALKRAAIAVADRLQHELLAAAGSKGNTLTAVYAAVQRALGKGA